MKAITDLKAVLKALEQATRKWLDMEGMPNGYNTYARGNLGGHIEVSINREDLTMKELRVKGEQLRAILRDIAGEELSQCVSLVPLHHEHGVYSTVVRCTLSSHD